MPKSFKNQIILPSAADTRPQLSIFPRGGNDEADD
jgi:hypothetical protein